MRKLRKLEARLAEVNKAIDAVRHSNPVPDHAPTSLIVQRQRLEPLLREARELEQKISNLEVRQPEKWDWSKVGDGRTYMAG